MIDLQCEVPAFHLLDRGFQVFPLSPNSKVPLKDTHGYLSATSEHEQLFDWIVKEPKMNLGLRLDTSELLVVDIDLHGDNNGRDSLIQLSKQGMVMPSDTYIEQSPNGGLHYFFKYQGKATRKVNIVKGIDILTDFVIVSPSEINGNQYKPVGDCTFDDVKPAPSWLIEMMKPDEEQSSTKLEIKFSSRKKYMGKLLDEIVLGTEVGNRNEWLTQLAGKLIWTGADAPTVYNMMCFANENLSQPISDKELNVIFRSIVNKERRVAN